MDLRTAQGVILGLLLFLTLAFSLVPIGLASSFRHTHDPQRRRRFGRILSLLSCFSGGIFLGTCLLDLFPEVQETVDEVLDQLGLSTKFPVSEFLVVVGFFLVLIIEQITLDCQGVDSEERTPLLHNHAHNEYQTYSPIGGNNGNAEQQVRHRHVTDENHPDEEGSHGASGEEFDPGSHSVHRDPASHSSLRAYLLLTALSLHSVFEGLAIGLQRKVDMLLQIFIAVILHKCVVAFSLSLNLVQSKLTLKTSAKLMLIFCFASPIGIGIGMGILEVGDQLGASIANGILQGLACGTFIYVTFFEILPHELNIPDDRMLKLIFTILGFSASCGIILLDPSNTKPRCYVPDDPSAMPPSMALRG